MELQGHNLVPLTAQRNKTSSAANAQQVIKPGDEKWDKENIAVTKISQEGIKNLSANGKEDVVIQTQGGELYKLSADELRVKNSKMPEANTNLSFAGIEGKVVYSDQVPAREIKLKGYSGMALFESSRERVEVRQIAPDKTYQDIANALNNNSPMYGNNIDEIVLETKDEKRYLFFADELEAVDGKMPLLGEKVKIGNLEGTVTTLDNEVNENRVVSIGTPLGAASAVLVGAIAGATVATSGLALAKLGGVTVASANAIANGATVVGAGIGLGTIIDDSRRNLYKSLMADSEGLENISSITAETMRLANQIN